MRKKRGQSSGAGAASLVAIIAALIVLYILFLEPADREELLGEDNNNHNNGNSKTENKNITVLLDEKPGRLDFLTDDKFEISIQPFNLYKTTNAAEIESLNDFSVRNGLFDKRDIEKSFFIDDLDNTDNVLLSFLAKIHNGILSIDLNGENIYEGSIETQNVEPISLMKQKLKQGENTLKFSVSGVGAVFWRTNEFSLSNVKVVGDITDISKQKTRNVFTVEPWKYNNLDKATLKFNPNCKKADVGSLDVMINGKNVFSGTPDCGILNKYEIPTSVLDAGLNDVVFTTNKGSYLIDQIKVNLELEELSNPLYWFEVSEKQLENITKGIDDLNLTMKFVDDDENKELDINVNGHMKRIDQEEPKFIYNINGWAEEGRNYIKLVPKDTVDIVSLKIELIKIDEDED